MKNSILLAICILLSGCSTIGKVAEGTVDIGKTIVTTGATVVSATATTAGAVASITADGVSLGTKVITKLIE